MSNNFYLAIAPTWAGGSNSPGGAEVGAGNMGLGAEEEDGRAHSHGLRN